MEGQGGDLFVAADVHYLASGGARAAAVVSADAAFSRLIADRVELVPEVEPYQPGHFYLRELPPLHAALDGLTGPAGKTAMALLVVDGYADLDPDGRPGLGAGQDWMKASRSALIVSAWVVGMPCGKPWYVFRVPFRTSFADSGPESA